MKNLVKQPFFHIILLVLVAGILGLLFKKYVANRENFTKLDYEQCKKYKDKKWDLGFIQYVTGNYELTGEAINNIERACDIITDKEKRNNNEKIKQDKIETCKGCKVIKNDEDEITGCEKTVDFIGNNGKVMKNADGEVVKQQMPCTGLTGFRCSPCDEYYNSLTYSDEKALEMEKDRIEVSSNDTPTVPPQQPANQNNITPNLNSKPTNPKASISQIINSITPNNNVSNNEISMNTESMQKVLNNLEQQLEASKQMNDLRNFSYDVEINEVLPFDTAFSPTTGTSSVSEFSRYKNYI